MTEFQAIDFQTYQAVQEAITVLENVNKMPYSVSRMGGGLGAAYAARLRELAATNVDNDENELSIEKIKAVCDQITGMVRLIKWIYLVRGTVSDINDSWIHEAVTALETVTRVALDPNPNDKN